MVADRSRLHLNIERTWQLRCVTTRYRTRPIMAKYSVRSSKSVPRTLIREGQKNGLRLTWSALAHLCDDGRFPIDFNMPKTVEAMRVLDRNVPPPQFRFPPPPLPPPCHHFTSPLFLKSYNITTSSSFPSLLACFHLRTNSTNHTDQKTHQQNRHAARPHHASLPATAQSPLRHKQQCACAGADQ